MSHVSFDYNKVREKLERAREEAIYCTSLRNAGLVDSCKDFGAGFELEETKLYNYYQKRSIDFTACVDDCLKEKKCVAITIKGTDCRFYSGNSVQGNSENEYTRGWKSVIFQHKIQSANINLTLQYSHIPQGERGTSSPQTNTTACEQSCFDDPQCDAFEYCNRGRGSWCESTTDNCNLFSMNDIKSVEREHFSFIKFIVRQ